MISSMANSENNLVTKVHEVDIASYPATIAQQIQALSTLQSKVESAKQKATDAKNGADSLDGYVRKKFLGIEYMSGNTEEKIEKLQGIVKDIAVAQEENAEATKLSFEFQEAISKTTEFLFALGCVDMAANEAMIDQIKKIRDGKFDGGKIDLTDDIKKRILEVAHRLKAHQDVLLQIESLKDKLKVDLDNLSTQQKSIKESAEKELADIRNAAAESRNELDQSIGALGQKQAETSSTLAKFKNATEKELADIKSGADRAIKGIDELNKRITSINDVYCKELESLKKRNKGLVATIIVIAVIMLALIVIDAVWLFG